MFLKLLIRSLVPFVDGSHTEATQSHSLCELVQSMRSNFDVPHTHSKMPAFRQAATALLESI